MKLRLVETLKLPLPPLKMVRKLLAHRMHQFARISIKENG